MNNNLYLVQIDDNLSLSSFYLALNRFIYDNGLFLEIRGKRVKEIRPFHLSLNNPLNRLLFVKDRDINPFFLAVEIIWILSGRQTVFPLNFFNSRMSEFSDDEINFNAPYGLRLRRYGANYEQKIKILNSSGQLINKEIDQLKENFLLLSKDKDTRRAIAVIWNPFFDLVDKKDLPCNDLLSFKIRNNQLDLTVFNRSNDLHWGLPTNIFQFTTIQQIFAKMLNVSLGTYYHYSDSLHIYLDNDLVDKMLKTYDFFEKIFNNNNYQFDFYNDKIMNWNLDFDIDNIKKEVKDDEELYDSVFSEIFQTQWAIEDLVYNFQNERYKNFIPLYHILKNLETLIYVHKDLNVIKEYYYKKDLYKNIQRYFDKHNVNIRIKYLHSYYSVAETYVAYKILRKVLKDLSNFNFKDKGVAVTDKEFNEFKKFTIDEFTKFIFNNLYYKVLHKDIIIVCANFLYKRISKIYEENNFDKDEFQKSFSRIKWILKNSDFEIEDDIIDSYFNIITKF